MIKYKYEINAWITVSKSLNERKDLILAIILNWKNADLTTEFFLFVKFKVTGQK